MAIRKKITLSDKLRQLGLRADAKAADVWPQFKRLASTLHPDKGGNGDEFATLKQVAEECIAELSLPVECEPCGGTGKVKLGQTTLLCSVCLGAGTIER
jgi:DnaJ-class molecular chaperone